VLTSLSSTISLYEPKISGVSFWKNQ